MPYVHVENETRKDENRSDGVLNANLSDSGPQMQLNNVEEPNELQITTFLVCLKGHGAPVLSADWLTEGSSIASVSTDNSIWFWDVETSSCSHSVLSGMLYFFFLFSVCLPLP